MGRARRDFAAFASLFDNLIQAVNILGSIFYGPTLGVFLVGFFCRQVRGTPVFVALVLGRRWSSRPSCSAASAFGYNVIGCLAVVVLASSAMPCCRCIAPPCRAQARDWRLPSRRERGLIAPVRGGIMGTARLRAPPMPEPTGKESPHHR